jgi:hypothetical protein
MAMDWSVIGLGLAGIVQGVGGYFIGRGKRDAGDAMSGAETELYKTLRVEISALHTEIVRLRSYVSRLERALREAGHELPPLEDIKVGGSD